MARQRMTRQELNRQRRARGFAGRTEKLTMFRDNLERNPQDEDFEYLFHVHGNAGVGKTSLVRQWETLAQARDAVTMYLDDDVHSPLEAMETVSVQLDRQGLPLRGFQELLAAYRKLRHEAETAPPALSAADPSAPGQQATATSTIAAQATLAGLGILPVPGAGALAGALDTQQVAQRLDQLRAVVASRLRSHDDVQLVLSPLQVLTPVFLQDLTKAAERRPRAVLFFDVFERTGPVLNEWLRDVLIGDQYGELPPNVIAVLSGQGHLDTRCWGDYKKLIMEVGLEVFTEEEARGLLATHGITDEPVIEVVFRLTGRLPVLLDLLAQTRPQRPTDVDDPADTAVDRFLKWIEDPTRRDAALACALPLQLNEDIYRAAVPEAAADQYAWLRELPFVTGRAGRARYHDVVRTPMLRLQRTRSAARWQQQHLRLADAYRRWRQDREAALPSDTTWDDSDWHEHLLGETYHRLCADPAAAWSATLPNLVQACDAGISVLRRWTQTLAQAGRDTEDSALTEWSRRLRAAADENAADTGTALTHLLSAAELSSADRALAHSLRGRDHRTAGRHEQALSDYSTALTLNPELARAHAGRGETHRVAGRHEDALADFDRSIELDPTDAWAIASRAQTYHTMERYEEALADFDHVIELDPADFWAITSRGQTYRAMGRHEDALADHNHAVELHPDSLWAVISRAQTHHTMGRYDDAVADFDRAIELNPDSDDDWLILAGRGETHRVAGRYDDALIDYHRAVETHPDSDWLIADRGETHRLAGHHEEALADFSRAIELDPTYAWAMANRARTYHTMERYEEALADFDRAVELNPAYVWAIANRGETHHAMVRYDDALADFDRAIELSPDSDWIIADRGETHRLAGRYDLALADFDRAVELDPAYAWAIASRARTYNGMKRYEEALADFDRAVALTPDGDWVLSGRGETHRLAGRYEDALTDFGRSIELNPAYAWAIASRGQTYNAMERYEEALADFDRAIELDPDTGWVIANRGETHRLAGRYEEALTDLDRAIGLDSDGSWYCHRALVLHLLGRAEERDDWRAARDFYVRETTAGHPLSRYAHGDVAVIHCALGEWDEAVVQLDLFLSAGPSVRHVREALGDLAELQSVLTVDPVKILPVLQRLHEAEAALEPGATP